MPTVSCKAVGSWHWCLCFSWQPRQFLPAPSAKKLLWSHPCSISLSSSQHQSLLPIPLGATDPISSSITDEYGFEGNLESVLGWSKRGIMNKQKLYLETVKYYLNRNYALSEWGRCGELQGSPFIKWVWIC